MEALEAVGDLVEVGDVALEALQPEVGAGVVDDDRLLRRADDAAEGAVGGRTHYALLGVDELVVVAGETCWHLERTADGVVDTGFVVVGADVALGDAEPVGAANALPASLVGDGLADTLRRRDGSAVAAGFARRKLLDAGGHAIDAGDGVGSTVVTVPASILVGAARSHKVAGLRSTRGGGDDSVVLAGISGRECGGVREHAVVAHADEGGAAIGLKAALGVDADESIKGTLRTVEDVDDSALKATLVEGQACMRLLVVVAGGDVGGAAVGNELAGLGGAVGFVAGAGGRCSGWRRWCFGWCLCRVWSWCLGWWYRW